VVRRRGGDEEEEAFHERRKQQPTVVSTTRIIEAIVIAAISTAIIHLYSLPRIEEHVANLERMSEKHEQMLNELRHDLYAPRTQSSHLAAYVPVEDK
jgi:cytochrome c-type biogenesis protein CcmH/NrfG